MLNSKQAQSRIEPPIIQEKTGNVCFTEVRTFVRTGLVYTSINPHDTEAVFWIVSGHAQYDNGDVKTPQIHSGPILNHIPPPFAIFQVKWQVI